MRTWWFSRSPEGLSNELSCRFHLYVNRPQQAIAFLLTAMRSYGRWGALAVNAALQQEFSREVAEVISVLTFANPIAQQQQQQQQKRQQQQHSGSHSHSVSGSIIRETAFHSPLRAPGSMLASSRAGLRGSSPVGGTIVGVTGVAGAHAGLHSHQPPVILDGAASSLADATAASSMMIGTSVGASAQMMFTAEYETEHFDSQQPLNVAASVEIPPVVAQIGSASYEGVTIDGSVQLGEAHLERVHDLDLKAIISSIQAISRELHLPTLISKLMKVARTTEPRAGCPQQRERVHLIDCN
jgi:hypothetical protein